MSTTLSNSQNSWRLSVSGWAALGVFAALLAFFYFEALSLMVGWWSRDEYSHGYLIPVIALYFIWQERQKLGASPFQGSWIGFILVAVGLIVGLVGQIGTIYTVTQYGFLIALIGVTLALLGWKSLQFVWIALALLVFMIPLPNFLYFNLSQKLQLLSSDIGVWFVRLFGVSVFLEGNVIDLGSYKLQVVEACNGLRYLFPLMCFGFISAVMFKAPFWQRAIVFLTTIPITVLMNSFRIGVIGVLVSYWGEEQAEGFLHDFEGWVIFMACVGILFIEMWLFARLINKNSLSQVFGFDVQESMPIGIQSLTQPISKPFIASGILVFIVAMGSLGLNQRTEVISSRTDFANFPRAIGDWSGTPSRLDKAFVDALKFTDYSLVDYKNDKDEAVNFYVAYYASQRSGASVHSPKSCIPGGGWEIQNFTQRSLPNTPNKRLPLNINRLVIQKGNDRQLVYYWFQQRGRIMTNEYLVKWYLFWDSITRNRSDGALVRLTTTLSSSAALARADERLTGFAEAVIPQLKGYIPD